MRKLVIAAALLIAAALVPGAPARAAAGCQCVKFGAPSVCMQTVRACNDQMHGVCLAFCSYPGKQAVKRHAVRRHAVKRRVARAEPVHPPKKHKVAKKPAPKKKAKKM